MKFIIAVVAVIIVVIAAIAMPFITIPILVLVICAYLNSKQ